MKIKRFDNIWIMGLILSGTILVVLYVVKLLFPSLQSQINALAAKINTEKTEAEDGFKL